VVNHPAQDKTPVQAALDLYAALRDSQPGDIAALTTPDVLCRPLVRPGLSEYHGHQGLADLARYAHAAYGDYAVTIISATTQPGQEVTVQARIDPQPGYGSPHRETTAFTFRNHLIATITTQPDE
jgi:hypothetical protein